MRTQAQRFFGRVVVFNSVHGQPSVLTQTLRWLRFNRLHTCCRLCDDVASVKMYSELTVFRLSQLAYGRLTDARRALKS